MPNNKVKIYLVGYPKSGTTWLIKLMSHVLRIPVKKKKGSYVPPSVEINNRLNLEDSDSCIIKAHDLPSTFFQDVDTKPERIIYIYRDFRAVFISAFFYFKIPKRFAYLFLLKHDGSFSFFKQILRLILYPFSRTLLTLTLKKYIREGITSSDIGTYDEHLIEWKRVASLNKEPCKFAFISYKDLMSSPEEALKDILESLQLPTINESWIKKAVAEESFDQMKSRLDANSNPIDVSKLRSGKTDDWKNYLSDNNLNVIANSKINDCYVGQE